MESISRALGRIEQLQDRLGVERRSGDFQAVLDANLGSFSTTGSGPTSSPFQPFGAVFGSGGIIPVAPAPSWGGVPGIATAADLDRYLATTGMRERNGHLHDHELMPVSGGWSGQARLLAPAATAWEAMRAAAAAEGVDLKVIDSYRDWHVQDRAHEAYLDGEKSAYVKPPGTSEHGVGLAVDVTNGSIVGPGDPEWEWLTQNARRFGWYPISNESWHWEFRGGFSRAAEPRSSVIGRRSSDSDQPERARGRWHVARMPLGRGSACPLPLAPWPGLVPRARATCSCLLPSGPWW